MDRSQSGWIRKIANETFRFHESVFKNYTSININERSLILLNPLSAVTKVNPLSIAVAAIKASGTASLIIFFNSIVFFLIEFAIGIT